MSAWRQHRRFGLMTTEMLLQGIWSAVALKGQRTEFSCRADLPSPYPRGRGCERRVMFELLAPRAPSRVGSCVASATSGVLLPVFSSSVSPPLCLACTSACSAEAWRLRWEGGGGVSCIPWKRGRAVSHFRSLQVPFSPALRPSWYHAHTTLIKTLQSGLCLLHLLLKLPPHAEPGDIYVLGQYTAP